MHWVIIHKNVQVLVVAFIDPQFLQKINKGVLVVSLINQMQGTDSAMDVNRATYCDCAKVNLGFFNWAESFTSGCPYTYISTLIRKDCLIAKMNTHAIVYQPQYFRKYFESLTYLSDSLLFGYLYTVLKNPFSNQEVFVNSP